MSWLWRRFIVPGVLLPGLQAIHQDGNNLSIFRLCRDMPCTGSWGIEPEPVCLKVVMASGPDRSTPMTCHHSRNNCGLPANNNSPFFGDVLPQIVSRKAFNSRTFPALPLAALNSKDEFRHADLARAGTAATIREAPSPPLTGRPSAARARRWILWNERRWTRRSARMKSAPSAAGRQTRRLIRVRSLAIRSNSSRG